jgi:hypothetical protein
MGLERLTDGYQLRKAKERMLGCAIFADERDADLGRFRVHDHDSSFCLLQFRDRKTTQPGRERTGPPHIGESMITLLTE